MSIKEDHHRDRKYKSGAQRRKTLIDKEIGNRLLECLKTRDSESEQTLVIVTHIKSFNKDLITNPMKMNKKIFKVII
jgi:ABC-type lipoprotein export system ATPase subunit